MLQHIQNEILFGFSSRQVKPVHFFHVCVENTPCKSNPRKYVETVQKKCLAKCRRTFLWRMRPINDDTFDEMKSFIQP